jgi:hypothetical protein
MANISSVNGILCVDIGSINGNAKIDIFQFDGIEFCVATPTPTPTVSPTNTPTPTPTQSPGGVTPTPTPTESPPCVPDCCFVELCYDANECAEACACNIFKPYYLHLPCGGDCRLSNADGIFDDSRCSVPAEAGFYSDGTDCWYWDTTNLTYQGPC